MFSFLTEPRYPSAALGVEADSLTAISLQGSKEQLSVRQAATIALPPGLIIPSFVDTNIVDTREFTSCLREVVENAGLLNQKRWSVTLPSGAARTAILTLENEPASKQEADEIIDWKAEQTFGSPAAEMRLAVEKVDPDKDGRSRYFAAAVKLLIIDEYESIFEGLGWRAGLILPRAVGEANWLLDRVDGDSLLISETSEGFNAMLMRASQPTVVRSVTCEAGEVEDEIFRLVMFYNDRFGAASDGLGLRSLLVIGKDLVSSNVRKIASEALGRDIRLLTSTELGLTLPGDGFSFEDVAGPAGLAALGV
ncbi:MAG: hypothetical protein JO053_15630 [Acidobacteria bacterium]|nr:hypothetical protein [Acidobacteriota bacterium]